MRSYTVGGWPGGASRSTESSGRQHAVLLPRYQRTFAEVDPPEWKVDDGRVFLLNENVLGEPFEVEYDVTWKSLTLEASQLTSRLL